MAIKSKKPTSSPAKAAAKKPTPPAAIKKAAAPSTSFRAAAKPAAKKPAVESSGPTEEKVPAVRAVRIPQTLRGMRDILPSEQKYWRHVTGKMESLALAYGYERIDTPVLEETPLFIRSVGKQSDVVEKELFTFVDRGGDSVSLRPEGTAPVARAYINHGMVNLPQPVKMYYLGSMFRYERRRPDVSASTISSAWRSWGTATR